MQPEGSQPASPTGAFAPSSLRGAGHTVGTNHGVSTSLPRAGLPETRNPSISEPTKEGLKKASSILLELEAGKREAEERNALNAKLFELGTELSKVRRVNDILEAENADLRERILHQQQAYPEAAEIRALARRYGPELAKSISLLIDENKSLRLKLQASIRAQARLQGTAATLGNALREHEERAYARELASAGRPYSQAAAAREADLNETNNLLPRSGQDAFGDQPRSPSGGNFVRRYCACSEKLQEILDCIDSQMGDYERGVWQTHINVLEEERDSLMLKTIVMRQRLAEVQARIVSDPFLAARFGGAGAAEEAVGLGQGRNAMMDLRDTIVQLATAQASIWKQDVNAELERRLATERNISRSWQANLRALQRELRDHLADLAVAARASGLRCDVLRGTIAQAGEAAALKEIQGFTRSEKESLRLLRLARDRIAADAHRLESYSIRVRELEQEVADLRCDMTRLDTGNTEEWDSDAQVFDCDYHPCAALPGSDAVPSDTDCNVAALRTAKQLLIDREETEKVIRALEDRKRQIHEQQENIVPSAEGTHSAKLESGDSVQPCEDSSAPGSLEMPSTDSAFPGSQIGSGSSSKKLWDALTTDQARDIFRRLAVLRKIASNANLRLEESKQAGDSIVKPSSLSGPSEGWQKLKQLTKDIDQREVALQQAEEAMQARSALRRVEAEHKKKMRKKEEEFEEQRRRDAMEAREEMMKQQKQYEQQLAKERDRCESLRKEMEVQAMELDLQRQLAEERIRERSQKQSLELEEELHKLRMKHRELECEMQRIKGDAAREALALKSAATEERAALSAAAQSAERKATEALKLVREKELELKEMEEKLQQSLASGTVGAPALYPSTQKAAKKGPVTGLKKFQAAAQKVAIGQTFSRLAKNKRSKTINPAASTRVSGAPERPVPKLLSPRSSFKKLLLGKCTSLARGFNHMDVDHSGMVKISEFANFVDDLGMNLPFSATHDLYNALCAPCEGILIFGDVEQPFNDAEIPPEGRVTQDQFLAIAGQAGISPACANNLWTEMDRANRGSLQRENVLLLLEDNVDPEEVERVERDAANVLSNVLNVFSGAPTAPKPEAKICKRSSFKKLTYTATRRELGFTDNETQVDTVLADFPPWDCMYPEDRKAMIGDMKSRTVAEGELIQAEDDPKCPLYVILKGTVDILEPGFIQYSHLESLSAPCLLFSDNIIEGTPNVACAKAGKGEDVFLYSLERTVFERSYEPLAIQRQREVEEYQKLLRKVPVVNKLNPELLRCLAATFRKQTFHAGEKIIDKGDSANRVLMVKDGEAVAVGLTDTDEELELRIYEPLDFFGDITTVKGRSHTASVKAQTDCTVLSIESDIFYSVLRKLEMEFRRRTGRSSTVDSIIVSMHSRAKIGVVSEGDRDTEDYASIPAEASGAATAFLSDYPEGNPATSTTLAIPEQEKTLVDQELIERLLQEDTERMREECSLLLEALPVFKDLPKERRQELCNRMALEIYFPNQAIVLQGEAPDKLYVVESGTVSIEIYLGCGKMQKIGELTSGSFFGEISIIKNEPRIASIIALTPVYALKAEDFKALLGDLDEPFLEHAKSVYSQKAVKSITGEDKHTQLSEEELPQVVHLLSGVHVIKLLSLEELHELARAFQVMEIREREVIMHEGDPADKFCIVLEGMVSIQKSPEPGKPRKEVAVVKAGEYLGEIGFLNNQPRTASCVAKTKVKLLSLGRAEFVKYLGHLADAFLQQAESAYSASETEMPEWLRDSKTQGSSHQLHALPDSSEETEETEGELSSGSHITLSGNADAKTHKEKREKKLTEGISEDTLVTAAVSEHEEDEKKKKKKKKSGGKDTSKEKHASTNSKSSRAVASIPPGELDRLRELVAGTFKNKYGSLAHAFAEMDVNKSDIVDADQEFYAFTKKSNIRGFQKREIDALFDELCRPIKGRLVVGNLYRNARGVEPTGAEIHLRAVEIYGSALSAFHKAAGLEATDLCTQENFTSLSAEVGVDNDKAERIWDEYVKGVRSGDGRITLSTLIGLMSGTVEEKTASGVPEATAAETSGAPAVTGSQNTSEPSDSLIQGMGGEVAESWPLVSISSSMFDSSEPLGLITLVSTVGSWVSAAFDKHDEEAEDEGDDEGDEGKEEKTEKEEKGTEKEAKKEKEDEPTGNLHLHRDKFGETAPEGLANSNIDGRQVSGGTREQALWIPPSSEVQQGLSGQPTVSHSSQTSEKASHGDDSHMDPQVFLHLCGQPTPILWTPGGFVPTHTETLNASDDNGDGVSQQTDPHLLQVPAPEVWTETENLLHSPSEPMSLRQVAENIEMWILDIGSEGLLAKGEGSVSSSDSLDETTGVPLPDFGGDNAFPEVHSDNRQILSDGGPGGANGYSALLQLGIGSRSPEEETSTSSSGGVLVKEEGEEEAGERCLHSAVPRCGAGDPSTVMHETTRGTSRQSAAKESSSLQLRSRSGKDSKIDKTQPKRSYRSRRSTKKEKNSGAAAANSAVIQDDFVPINITEPSDFTDKSESLRAKPAAEANVLEKQLSASGTGENAGPNTTIGELSTEEASAKEASVRSWGNRIWAFFGREAEAERANAGEDNPMDVVERTLPFEDPAVVQRDDHRAFPSETSLLLESIKQEPTLQFLSPQQQRYVASLMRRDIFPASTAVVEEGAEPSLMWCSSGEFEVSQAGFFGASVVRSMTPGEFFGLEELVSGEKLKYTLTSRQSASECALWVLDRDIFNDSVKDMLSKRRAFVPVAQSFLHTVRLIRDLPEEEIAAVAKACKVERFAEGQTVFKMGFHGDMFCFIYKGEAITQKPQDDGGFLELARQGKGEYFGEMALIRNTRRTASVVAGTELVLFCLDKESFETLLSPLKEKMAAKAASTYKRQDDAPATQNEGKPAETTTLDPMLATRDAAEACAKKRTRKNSLALLNYSKIRDQERQAENGEGDATEEKFTARWRLAREPESIHEPPPLCAQGGRSCLKENNPQGKCRKRKSPVRFDEGSLLPSESSSDGD
ncbi:CAMP-dependent protein kinase regulatory subunit, putative [Eimeria mitis]|uniref:cAMP-dependent protein kinase regulatory subunit, putative n=1 Tax=Eimeria mitis TaxID=44415 RepID=U6KK67_9EIME|nr:CAMP-dependent protein kinase regulatory subunit, putative [Eimeria mitis]CDJ36672.1 CAMP-dependent protein kinase regulatory subunit, putative [Eimeria mitis]